VALKITRILLRFLSFALMGLALTASAVDPLESGFLNPPDSAKPQTWWHWMNGNISKEGITADLEAMKQIGLGGATIINVDCSIPRGDVPFMSPVWREDFKFAVQEADRLGLKLCVENCAGWSSSGGPWNTVTNAMQRLTSSQLTATGPTILNTVLPLPPVTLGYYRDIAVLAFKDPWSNADTDANSAQTAARLEISHAVFQAKGDRGSTDVTAKIRGRIQSGLKSIAVSNQELGGDPAPGSVKQLRVDFSLDGIPASLTVDEGDTLIFPANTNQLAAIETFEKILTDRTFVQPPSATVFFSGEAIPHAGVVDLTAKLGADNRLQWDVPPGNWIILRLGYTPIGVNNHPAPAEGTGLECDKLDPAALDAHWDGFMQKVLDDIGPLAGKTLNASLIDSYEIGNQDWTPHFREEFQKRRGYDPLPFLPTFNRCIVDNPAVTERFLWDMRRTVADLFAENYYGHFSQLCRQHGLSSAIEPYTGPFESLQSGAPDDVVMGEFWAGSQGDPSIKMAASVAHIYGKTIVGAESFTGWPSDGRWQDDPYSLKPLGDLMFCEGINRYVFHRYAMQPWTNRWPGITMGPFGINFERTVTWWNQGAAWIKYLSRCQFLLQQGRSVADAAYFDGQSGATVVGPRPQHSPSLEGYPGCDQQVKSMAEELWGPCDGKTVLEHDLGKGHVFWSKPLAAVFTSQNLKPDFEIQGASADTRLAYTHRGEGPADLYFISNQRRQSDSAECTFRVSGRIPELWHPDTGAIETAPIWSVHDGRTTVRLDLDPAGSVFVIFRRPTTGSADHLVEREMLTRPANTTAAPASQWEASIAADGSPMVKAWGDGHFKLITADGKVLQADATNLPAPQEITSPWNLTFPPDWGAPPAVSFDKLISWTADTHAGVRYFSGSATYENDIDIPSDRLSAGRELWLDLGMVKNFAEVSLNSKDLGVFWKPPFRVNVSAAAKAGINKLAVKVTNLWPNRIIGDEQLPADCEWNGDQLRAWPQWLLEGKPSPTGRFTFETWHHYSKNSALLESGLLGPVTLRTAEIIPAR